MLASEEGVVDMPFKLVVTAIVISLMALSGWQAVDRVSRADIENRMGLVIERIRDALEYAMYSAPGTSRTVKIEPPTGITAEVEYISIAKSNGDGNLVLVYRYSFSDRERTVTISWKVTHIPSGNGARITAPTVVKFVHEVGIGGEEGIGVFVGGV